MDEKGRAGLKFNVPLLLMHGQQDRTDSIRRDMPHWSESETFASYHVIPDTGHNANQDNHIFSNEKTLEFLQQHAS